MKKHFLTLALLATVAIGGAFASQSNTTNSGNLVANKTVYYKLGTTCTPIQCSDINNQIPCRENTTIYSTSACNAPEPAFLYQPIN